MIQNFKSDSGFEFNVINPHQIDKITSGNKDLPLLLLMSGTSESGKSTLGKLGLSTNIASRIKYLKISANILFGESNPNVDLVQEIAKLESKRSEFEDFISKFEDFITNLVKDNGGIAVVETLKHPLIVKYLKDSEKVRAISIFIDADLELRTKREAIKSGNSESDVYKSILEKDSSKNKLGLEKIKEMSDIIIYNNGTYEDYTNFASNFLKELQNYSAIPVVNNPIEYS